MNITFYMMQLSFLFDNSTTNLIPQYTGKWYEVLRYHPIIFEFGLKCGTAEYAIKENGNIEVKNTGTPRL